ncbi:MAG: DUF1802 family protein [Cyanobacteria bacterium P01_A01_bin.114]
MTPLTTALKEWAVAVEALTQGESILLLRKGGIREQGGQFSVAAQQVLLYPTYEHQKPHLLKPTYAQQVQTVAPGWHPETVSLAAWATITHIFKLHLGEARDLALLTQTLHPFHIWNDTFVTERLRWKPGQPLYFLLLRVYQLPAPIQLSWSAQYGGCRSWLTLEQTVNLENSVPVLPQAAYQQQVNQIRLCIETLRAKAVGAVL